MPNSQRPVFAAGDDDRQLRVKRHRTNIVRVSIQSLHARFRLVIPNLHQLIVRAGNQIRSIPAGKIIHAIHPFLVTFQREIRSRLANRPHLHGSIQTRRRERVRIFRIKARLHDVVRMTFENLHAIPIFLPRPQLNQHIVRARQHERLRRVHAHGPDVICVRFEGFNKLRGVVVIHSNEHIVRPTDDPLFAQAPFRRSHRQLRHIEALH